MSRRWLALLAAAALAIALVVVAVRPRRAREMFSRAEDVIYGRKFGTALTLDVFTPVKGANGAGVIFVVSSGWKSEHELIQLNLTREFLNRGYVVFAVVHGSQPRYDIPSCIADVTRAVRFVRAHAADYNLDPLRIGIAGNSAGGHLALMLATAGDRGDEQAEDPIDRESSRVQAAGCLYPPTDFLNYGNKGEIALGSGILDRLPAPFDFDVLDPAARQFRRVSDEAKRQQIGKQISPIYHVTPDDPPTLIIHGDADPLVPIQQAERFLCELKAAGVEGKLIVKAGASHGGPEFADGSKVIADWFDKHLAGSAAGAAANEKP